MKLKSNTSEKIWEKDINFLYHYQKNLKEKKKWCSRISTYPLFGEFASNDYLYWCFNYWNGEKIASLMIPGGNLFSPLAINRVKKVAAMLYEEKPISKIIAWVKAL